MAPDDTYTHYVDGEWTDGTGSETFDSENPATGESLATFRRGTEADVDAALSVAEAAFAEWRELSHIDR
jgi:aldehyde dehydrogenase (NAD+)